MKISYLAFLAPLFALLHHAESSDLTVAGNLNVTGEADIHGNGLDLGAWSTDPAQPGSSWLYQDGTMSVTKWLASRTLNEWVWQHTADNSQPIALKLDSTHRLLLFSNVAGVTSPKITLDPSGGTSVFETNLTLNGANNLIPNQTITGGGSVLNITLGDERYARLGVNLFTGTQSISGGLALFGSVTPSASIPNLMGYGAFGGVGTGVAFVGDGQYTKIGNVVEGAGRVGLTFRTAGNIEQLHISHEGNATFKEQVIAPFVSVGNSVIFNDVDSASPGNFFNQFSRWGALRIQKAQDGIDLFRLYETSGNAYFKGSLIAVNSDFSGALTAAAASSISAADGTVPLSIKAQTEATPTGILIEETSHASSKRAAMKIGYWQMMQDIYGNGTRDFTIGNPGGYYAIYCSPTGKVSLGGQNNSLAPSEMLDVTGNIKASGNITATNISATGVIRVAPQGDISMGDFTNEPTP